MTDPYWCVVDEIAYTDALVPDLTAGLFHKWFPHAMPISKQEYEDRSVTLAQYMRWRRK